jgi:uncharacterized protein YdaU (DUF1376 family)
MTKNVDTWMPLLVDKYLGDTTDLTTEQHGAYLLLLMSMWKKGGSLPNVDETLLTITHLKPARWRLHKAVLLSFFRVGEDGQLHQKRLTQELQRARRSTTAKSESGTKGAAKRWQTDGEATDEPGSKTGSKTGGEPPDKPPDKHEASVVANGSQTVSQTDASIPTPSSLRSEPPPPSPAGSDPPPELPAESPAGGSDPAETPSEPTPYGSICRQLRRAGIGDASPHQQRFRMLVDAGATAEEFLALVPHALKVGDRPFAYLLGAVEGERKRAVANAGQLHRGPMPGTPESAPWYETAGGVKAKGAQLGVPYTAADDCEPFLRYKARVLRAVEQAEHA